jgi:hypothetical protein
VRLAELGTQSSRATGFHRDDEAELSFTKMVKRRGVLFLNHCNANTCGGICGK